MAHDNEPLPWTIVVTQNLMNIPLIEDNSCISYSQADSWAYGIYQLYHKRVIDTKQAFK